MYPADELILKNSGEKIYIEVYVSDVVNVLQPSVDISTGKARYVFYVNVPSEKAIGELYPIPKTYCYVSKYSPSIVV